MLQHVGVLVGDEKARRGMLKTTRVGRAPLPAAVATGFPAEKGGGAVRLGSGTRPTKQIVIAVSSCIQPSDRLSMRSLVTPPFFCEVT